MRVLSITIWAAALCCFAIGPVRSDNSSPPEIVIGNVLAPSSDGYTATAIRVSSAYFRMVNAAGGINGRPVKLISYDAKGDLRRTLDLTRRLVEADKATVLYQMDPAAYGNAVYVRLKKIPQLFDARPDVRSGSSGIPAMTQGVALGKAINELMPDSQIALLYREDGFSNEALDGLYAGLGLENARRKIKNRDEVTDPSTDHVAAVGSSRPNVLVVLLDLEGQRQVLKQMERGSWWPITFMTDAAVSLDKDELQVPGAVVSIENRMTTTTDGVSETEKSAWENFSSSHLSVEDAASSAARASFLQARALVNLLEVCGEDQRQTCLQDQYRMADSRWIAQTVVFEQGAWKYIGPQGPTIFR